MKPFIDDTLKIGDIVNPDCSILKGWIILDFVADQNHEKAKMILEHPVTKERTCLENRHYNINK